MNIDNLSEMVARIQFIADVSQIAHCKEDELKMALSMISDMAVTIDTSVFKAAIYRQAECLIAPSLSTFTNHLSGGFLLLHQSAYAYMNPHDPNWIANPL